MKIELDKIDNVIEEEKWSMIFRVQGMEMTSARKTTEKKQELLSF